MRLLLQGGTGHDSMRIDIDSMEARFRAMQRGRESHHTAASRVAPSVFQYDYLTLSTLASSIAELLAEVQTSTAEPVALDLGSDRSPYAGLLQARGYRVKTLDLVPASGADYLGTAEETGLPSETFDLVLCTQVLEHCDDPGRAMSEIHRILKPGGHVIVSAPHVWFFHPHPRDHWRFTQEGMIRVCRNAQLRPLVLLGQGGTLLTVAQIANFLAYGVLGRLGAPVYVSLNLLGMIVDRIAPNDLFCHNFACLAERDVISPEPRPRSRP